MHNSSHLHQNDDSINKPYPLFLIAVFWTIGFLIFFRRWLLSEFDQSFGTEGDARILIALLEHWYRVFSGELGEWRNPTFFYPTVGVLGFTDAYFLYALPYSLFRIMGSDPFFAFMSVMAGLSLLGFVSFMLLAIRHFGASIIFAGVGAYLFAFSNMMAIKMDHAQSYCAMFLPIIIHLTLSAFKKPNRHYAVFLATAAGLLHALVFFTAFLTGWFFATFCILGGLIYCLLIGRRQTIALVKLGWTNYRHIMIGYLVGFALGILPFLLIYLPVRLQGVARNYKAHRAFAPNFIDIINLGHGNLIWGSFLDYIGAANRPKRPVSEIELGYSPTVFLIWIASVFALFLKYRRRPLNMPQMNLTLLAMGFALIGYWLLQLNYFGFRPWSVIWAITPGASGVRTTFRSQVVLNLAASLLVLLALQQIWRQAIFYKHAVTVALAGVVTLILAEQINHEWPSFFSRQASLYMLETASTMPPECRVFYIVPGAGQGNVPWFALQADAMLLSTKVKIPTINGLSSVLPNEWKLLDPGSPTYIDGLKTWIKLHNLQDGLCGVDPRALHWIIGEPKPVS